MSLALASSYAKHPTSLDWQQDTKVGQKDQSKPLQDNV